MNTIITKFIVASLFLLIIVLNGCDGAAGPDGEDAPFTDREPPEIQLLSPDPFTEITDNTMLLWAQPRDSTLDDLVGIEFFVNGSSLYNGDTAIVRSSPYQFVWDFNLAGTPYGNVTISAVAHDTAGNSISSALRLVSRGALTGLDTLFESQVTGSLSYLALPYTEVHTDTAGQIEDTLSVEKLARRFTAQADCRLEAAWIYLVDRGSEYRRVSDLYTVVYESEDGIRPSQPRDSLLIHTSLFDTERWLKIEFPPDDPAYHFEEGESFFIGIIPRIIGWGKKEPIEISATGPNSGLVLRTTYEEVATDSADLEQAWWYEQRPDSSLWVPVASKDPNGYVHHLHIRALVDYGGGE